MPDNFKNIIIEDSFLISGPLMSLFVITPFISPLISITESLPI
jgi:hypothetical protein